MSDCPIERAISVVDGRWKAMVLHRLFDGPHRYGRIRRALAGCAERTLVTQLCELEADGVIDRIALGGNPPMVEYRLTELGRSLKPVFDAPFTWGTAHQRHACDAAGSEGGSAGAYSSGGLAVPRDRPASPQRAGSHV